jgi:error-prone DNA polymerase
MVERFAGIDRAAAERTVWIAERLAFDLTEELGYGYPDFSDRADPAIRQLHAICDNAFGERYGSSGAALRREARRRLESELALIEKLGLAGFFLLHHEVLELARECALEVRGRDSPRMFPAAGAGRAARSARSSATITGLSHIDPVENGLSLGRFINHELTSVPDIDLDFPRDIREKLIVRVTERYGHEHAALVASFATYRSRARSATSARRSGCRSRARAARRVTDGWHAERVADEVAALPDAEPKLLSKRWRAFQFLTRRDRRAAAPRPRSTRAGW